MKFSLRKSGEYAQCYAGDGSVTIDLGFLDNAEAKRLLEDFRAAVDDLEWFVNSTEKAGITE